LLGNSNGEVETIRLQTGESIAKFAQHTSLINCIRVLSDENMFLVSSRDGKLSIYQCETRPNMKISFLGYC
jgi:WD40 repeat protein